MQDVKNGRKARAISCLDTGKLGYPSVRSALDQQRLAGRLRQRIGEAVTEIQRCGMAAAAEIQVGLASDPDLLLRDRLNADQGPLDERMQPPPGVRTGLVVDDNFLLPGNWRPRSDARDRAGWRA
jgi:hypothetical protein